MKEMRKTFGFLFGVVFAICLFSTSAFAVCVKVSIANLRSGPGTNYSKTWEAPMNMPLKKIDQKGSWLQVQDVDGDKHWIHKRLVTDDYLCAIVKVTEANIRKGPGTNYPKVYEFPVLKYTSFRYITKKGSWAKIKDPTAEEAWIYRSLIWVY